MIDTEVVRHVRCGTSIMWKACEFADELSVEDYLIRVRFRSLYVSLIFNTYKCVGIKITGVPNEI